MVAQRTGEMYMTTKPQREEFAKPLDTEFWHALADVYRMYGLDEFKDFSCREPSETDGHIWHKWNRLRQALGFYHPSEAKTKTPSTSPQRPPPPTA